MSSPFLITGCGRSGTGWAAALFTTLGHPCTHEGQFTWNKTGPLMSGESSWLAVPHLALLPRNTPVLRIMRDPYAVVQSIMARGFLRHGADIFDGYVEHHRPDIFASPTHLGRAIRYVALWDEPLEGENLLRVDGTTHRITGAMRYATGARLSRADVGRARTTLGTAVNTTPQRFLLPTPTIDQIENHPDGALIFARAQRFGYGD